MSSRSVFLTSKYHLSLAHCQDRDIRAVQSLALLWTLRWTENEKKAVLELITATVNCFQGLPWASLVSADQVCLHWEWDYLFVVVFYFYFYLFIFFFFSLRCFLVLHSVLLCVNPGCWLGQERWADRLFAKAICEQMLETMSTLHARHICMLCLSSCYWISSLQVFRCPDTPHLVTLCSPFSQHSWVSTVPRVHPCLVLFFSVLWLLQLFLLDILLFFFFLTKGDFSKAEICSAL